MSNGVELNEQLEFKERIKAMQLSELTMFIAEQTYTLTNKVDSLDSKFNDCISGNSTNKKTSAISGGISGTVMAVIIGLIEYFKPK